MLIPYDEYDTAVLMAMSDRLNKLTFRHRIHHPERCHPCVDATVRPRVTHQADYRLV